MRAPLLSGRRPVRLDVYLDCGSCCSLAAASELRFGPRRQCAVLFGQVQKRRASRNVQPTSGRLVCAHSHANIMQIRRSQTPLGVHLSAPELARQLLDNWLQRAPVGLSRARKSVCGALVDWPGGKFGPPSARLTRPSLSRRPVCQQCLSKRDELLRIPARVARVARISAIARIGQD